MRCASFQMEMLVGGYKISTKVEYGKCKGYVYILVICAVIFRFRTIKLDRGEITNKRLYILLRRRINCVYWVSVCFFLSSTWLPWDVLAFESTISLPLLFLILSIKFLESSYQSRNFWNWKASMKNPSWCALGARRCHTGKVNITIGWKSNL